MSQRDLAAYYLGCSQPVVRTGRVRVGAPQVFSDKELDNEIARINGAIVSLNKDVESQISYTTPEKLDNAADAAEFAGVDPTSSVIVRFREQAKKIKARNAKQTGAETDKQLDFGNRWMPFFQSWDGWKNEDKNSLGKVQQWDALNVFAEQYQKFLDEFVSIGGKPTAPKAETPNQADDKKPGPFSGISVPSWVWPVGILAVVGIAVYFLAPIFIARRVAGG